MHVPSQYTNSSNTLPGLMNSHQQTMHHPSVATRHPSGLSSTAQAQYPGQYDHRYEQSNAYGYRPQDMQGSHGVSYGRMEMEDQKRVPTVPQPHLHIQSYDTMGSQHYPSHSSESLTSNSRYQSYPQSNSQEALHSPSPIGQQDNQANRGSLPNSPTSETESSNGKRIIMACHQW